MMPRAPRSFRRLPGLLIVALAVLVSPTVARAGWFADDQGFYRVYQADHLLGTEHITFEERNDSSVVVSMIGEMLPRPGSPPDTLRKNAVLAVSSRDGSLRGYQSHENVNGVSLSRSLSMSADTYTSYRQSMAGGFGDTYELPPGRVYIVDPQVFSLFDVIGRDMHGQPFDERPITLIYITSKDTSVSAVVKRLGKVPFPLGKQSVMAEKFSIKDPWSEFLLWVSPSGRMLRLTLPAMGLRVDRDADSLKPGRRIREVPTSAIGEPEVLISPTPPRAPSSPDSLPAPRR